MFLKKEDIKAKIRNIILDEKDNDIAFVVAAKGVGKLNLLEEIYDLESSNTDVIVANGKRINNSSSCIEKCYIDGICSYIERNDSLKTREDFLRQLPNGKLTARQRWSFLCKAFVSEDKRHVAKIASYLSNLSPKQLKEIYIGVAGETPLVIFAGAIWLTPGDIDYLANLHNDDWGARITFIIAVRPTIQCINFMKETINKDAPKVWVFPLLPETVGISNSTLPKSVASISINNIGNSENYYDFHRSLIANQAYFEMYDIVHSLFQEGLHPINLCLMANQEMSNETYCDLQKIITSIYPNSLNKYDQRLVLPYDGRLLWIDALAYYIALYEGIDDAIIATQQFFFAVIAHARHFEKGFPTRAKFISFLKNSERTSANELAMGFASYYSSFATFAKTFSSKEQFEKNSKDNSLMAIELLDRAVLEFSDEAVESSVELLGEIYKESQTCSILDICLETIIRFFEKHKAPYKLKSTTVASISSFQSLCISAAYQWLDITLLDKLVDLQKSIQRAGYSIKIDYKELMRGGKEMLLDHFKKRIEKNNLRMEDVVLGATIFLSYTHADNEIANKIDTALRGLGHDVKRDIRDVGAWDDLQSFMKSIRKQDYAVFLVSNQYLHSANCLYEIMEFMKDENSANRAFPIAIEFTETEKKTRKVQNRPTSMFDDFYWIEIVQYWEDYARNMDDKLEGIKRENTVELASRYRIVKELAQTASKFFGSSFSRKLLATIDPENVSVDKTVGWIDEKISLNMASNPYI